MRLPTLPASVLGGGLKDEDENEDDDEDENDR